MSVTVKKMASPRRNRRETNESDKTASTFTSKLDSDKVDKNDTPWITQEGREDMVKDFNFYIDDLPIKREIDRDVDVDELMDLEYITDGSSSNIFSARWRNEDVIVKMLQDDKADDIVAINEFEIEGELLSRLEHPNIIKVLGSGVDPRPFLILERLRDISQLLDLDKEVTPRKSIFNRGPFTFFEVLQLAKDLADALNYTHCDVHPDAMIIHRDLKPENLGLSAEGRLKVYDFGLCRCVEKRTNQHQLYEMTGNTGSLRYMAPEVVLNQEYSEKVDVYSFAIVVWTIACNKPPFRTFDRTMHLDRVVLKGERPSFDPTWPPDFIDLLGSCWQPESHKRPSFAMVSTILDEIMNQSKIINKSKSFFNKLSFSKK